MIKNEKGFTLVETVIALAVSALLIFTIIDFMTNSLVRYAVANARAGLMNQAQASLDIIGNDIRLSANADDDNRWQDTNAPGAPSNLFSWQSNSTTLILATAAENTSGDIIFSDPAQYISAKNNNIYFLTGGVLYKRTIAATVANNGAKTSCPSSIATALCPADRKMLTNVKTFSFKYFNDTGQEVTPTDARSIEMHVTLEEKQYGEPVSVDYTTRMVFRND